MLSQDENYLQEVEEILGNEKQDFYKYLEKKLIKKENKNLNNLL